MSVEAGVWSCPDCPTTVRGNHTRRHTAQLEHAPRHRAEQRRRVAAEQKTAEVRAAQKEARRREREARAR